MRLGQALRLARNRSGFPGSQRYWEQRYAAGGSSGPGSYGLVADYKARFLNDFVVAKGVASTIEFGCGDGNQLSLGSYPAYIGLDVSTTALAACRRRFADDATKSFFLYSPYHFVDHHRVFSADLAISLDVILHLVEDDVFEIYMQHLFSASRRHVVIYSSNGPVTDPAAHVRHRTFSTWVEAHQPDWAMVASEQNPHRAVAVADFYLYEKRPIDNS